MEDKEYEEFNLEDELKNNLLNNNIDGIIKNDSFIKKFNFNINNSNSISNLSFVPYNIEPKIPEIFFNNCSIGDFELDNYKNKTSEILNVNSIKFVNCNFQDKNIIKSNLNYGNNNHILDVFSIIDYDKGNNGGFINLYFFKINSIDIQQNNIINTKNSYFNKINIQNNLELKKILIDNIHIGELVFKNITNNFEAFEIRNCVIDKLVIRNSNLGKAVFNGVTIKQLEIQNATLNDCIFNGVDFDNNYELTEIEKEKGIIDYKVMKDNYRQLKHVMDKNANYTEANEFYALEMDNYYKNIKIKKKKLISDLWNFNINTKDIKYFGELSILSFTKWINNFGSNLILNIIILIGFAGVTAIGKFYYLDNITNNGGKSTISEYQSIYLNNLNDDGFILSILSLFFTIWLVLLSYGLLIKFIGKNIIIGLTVIILFIGFFINSEIFTNFVNLLLNPTYGIKMIPNITNNFSLLGLLIYKLFYGILIYQLIIALKRTTKR